MIVSRRRRVLIVGAGIAGAALALFLERAGFEPVLWEAYARDADAGAAFQIAPNGMRVLAMLGLDKAVAAAGHLSRDMAFRNHRGDVIAVIRTASAGDAVNIFRTSVHRALRDALDRASIEVRYSARIESVRASESEAFICSADGSEARGDILVGADGVRSSVRAWITPESTPRDTGMVSIGGICAPGAATPLDRADSERITFMMGPRHQFGYSKMSATRWAWWCHAHGADEAERAALRRMSVDEARTWALARYRGWAAPCAELIEATEATSTTRIFDVPSLPTWHRGRALVLGDAAHAMSPAGGQGASLALEDAMVFAHLLTTPGSSIDDAIARFEKLRKAKAEAIVAQAYANDRRSLKETGPTGMWVRDRVLMPMLASFIGRELKKVYAGEPLDFERGADTAVSDDRSSNS